MASVLVVEDDGDTAALIRRWLARDGHEVTVAADAEAGLGVLRHRGFDLLLVDVKLPGMSGFELIDSVRTQGLPAAHVAITTITDESDSPDGLAVGAWLAKPFTREQLREAVGSALGGP